MPLPRPPSCCIVVGAIKSAKSNLVLNFLANPDFYKDKFEIVRVLSSTLLMDDKGKMLNKYFDCDDHYEDAFIDSIIESQGQFSKEERPTYCLVLDDIISDEFCKRNNKLAYFITKMRHYIDMCILSVQSINHIPPLIRAQARDIIIGRQNNHKEKIKLMEQFSGLLGENGDKVFYDGNATGLSTGTYFVNKVSSRRFQLAETILDVNSNPVRTVNITANTGGSNQSIAPVNPRIAVVNASGANTLYQLFNGKFNDEKIMKKILKDE